MEQILAHLVGDYVLQTDKQAKLKHKSFTQALIHAFTYSLPFIVLRPSMRAWLLIFITHALIDHYNVARYVIRLKNSLGDWPNRATFATNTGYPEETPAFLSFWLLIIADNTMHLLINYSALRWL